MAVTQNNLVNGDYEYSHTQFKLHHWAPNNKHTIHFQQWLSYIHPSIIATNINSYYTHLHVHDYACTSVLQHNVHFNFETHTITNFQTVNLQILRNEIP